MKKKKIKILISAGPTREPIDPVRFISNYSTGALGYKIAGEAVRRGYKTILVSGVTALAPPSAVKLISVNTALEMQKVLSREFKTSHCLIMNAAVCDYRPHKVLNKKLKKHAKTINIELVRNPDILKSLAKHKKNRFLIGFSLETENVFENAFCKLKDKNLDLVVALKVNKNKTPFGLTRVNALIINKQGETQKIVNITKPELAQKLLDRVEGLWYTNCQQ